MALEFVIRLGLRAFEAAKRTTGDVVERTRSAREALRQARAEAQSGTREAKERLRIVEAGNRAAQQGLAAQVGRRVGVGAQIGAFAGRVRQARGDVKDVFGAAQNLAAGDVLGAAQELAGVLPPQLQVPVRLLVAVAQVVHRELDKRAARDRANLVALARVETDRALRSIQDRLRQDPRFADALGARLAARATAVAQARWQHGWTPQNRLEAQ